MLFRRKISELEEENKQLALELADYKCLIKHIIKRCDNCCETQYYGNPSIGFRSIRELANTFNTNTEVKPCGK